MRLSTYQRSILCAALESFSSESREEADAISALLTAYSAATPYAPFRTATDWRTHRLRT